MKKIRVFAQKAGRNQKKNQKKAASKLEIGKKRHKQTEARILTILVKLTLKKKNPRLSRILRPRNPLKTAILEPKPPK